ncbi:MAG: hypothetical protein GX366_00620 [Epulopiscium sp.]|nr:hypothetical protein [Candidatus Epulonipiscium sp.]
MFNYTAMPPRPHMTNMCPYCMSDISPCKSSWMPQKQNYSQNPSCDMYKHQDEMEISYIKTMYPPLCKNIQTYINRELNKYDHKLSPIYEMYPARETIDYIANCVYSDIKANSPNLIKKFEEDSLYTLIYTLLLNEMYRKRMHNRLYD